MISLGNERHFLNSSKVVDRNLWHIMTFILAMVIKVTFKAGY